MTAKPSTPAPAPKAQPSELNERNLELGGGALAILALGGAAFALSRRRRRQNEEQWYSEEAAAPQDYAEPVAAEREPIASRTVEQQPRIVAPASSAFAWSSEAQRQREAETASEGRKAGESWVDRAYRGPTPDNPSLSLRKRLKRAAFFDKREREAAEGRVAPVDPNAGLPESSTADEKELVAA